MPFARPTLSTLIAQAQADIGSSLPGADALLRYSNLGVLAYVLAAAVNGLYGYLDWIAQNGTPFTATGEYLEAWAALKGVTREAATSATGPLSFPATGSTAMPAGTPVVRAADGAAFSTLAAATASGGAIAVNVVAATAGAAGNTPSGAVFTLGTAIAGITSAGVSTAALTGGADVEADASLRTRMLQAFSAPSQGGDLADYVTWALQVPGVTRAWNAGVALGAGTVQIYFMMDATEAAYNGFPQGTNGVAGNETRATAATGDQLAVANHIYPLRPVTALVYAYAPGANTVNFTILGIGTPSTATQTAIAAAIAGVLTATAAPGGVTDANGNAIGVVNLSDIEAAIGAVPGTEGFVISAMTFSHGTLSPSGVGNITSSTGYLAVLGTVTY